MNRTVIVPLDGSERAECALPLAALIAARTGAPLRLIHVHAAGDTAFNTMDAAERYIRSQVDRLRNAATVVSGDVMRGEILDTLRHESARRHVGCLVMAAGGAGGERQGFGRVSAGLIAVCQAPIVLCGPAMSTAGTTGFGRGYDVLELRNIAVFLDRTADTESAIPLSVDFARRHDARITLISVVAQDAGREMESYLDAMADRIDQPDLPVSRRLVHSNDTAGSMVRAALEEDADMIALGRGYLARDPAATAIVVASRQPLLL